MDGFDQNHEMVREFRNTFNWRPELEPDKLCTVCIRHHFPCCVWSIPQCMHASMASGLYSVS